MTDTNKTELDLRLLGERERKGKRAPAGPQMVDFEKDTLRRWPRPMS